MAWTIAGLIAISVVLSGQPVEARREWIIWLCAWLPVELVVSYVWMWWNTGLEIITIDHGILTIEWSILDYGWKKAYAISRISHLRTQGPFGSPTAWASGPAEWGVSGGTIAFDYNGKTKRFGIHLIEPDATELACRLNQMLQSQASSLESPAGVATQK